MALFRKNNVQMDRFVDMHNHILPGIDDGSRDMGTTLEMLEIAAENGITDMIVTPHFKNGHHNAGGAKIEQLIEMVSEEMRKRGLDIKLYPGNEIYYFDGAAELVAEGKAQSMNGTDRVLMEFHPSERYTYIRNAVDAMSGAGFVPIIAHVERYMCIVDDPNKVVELRMMNAEIQLNASSIVGKLGPKVKKFTHKLLREELVDYIGTDAHDTDRRAPEVRRLMPILHKLCDEDYVRAITCDNALSIIEA